MDMISTPVVEGKREKLENNEGAGPSWAQYALPVKNMNEKYHIIKPLDKGSFGEVSIAKLIASSPKSESTTPSVTASVSTATKKGSEKEKEKTFVIKKIDKDKASDILITNEIEAGLKLLEHEGIPKFIETFIDSKFCYLIFEYFPGENLYTFLEARNFKPLREGSAKRIFRQIISALLYCHQNKICHRDLKLENILYNPKKKQARLIDFGLCAINASHCNELCTNWCGSPDYVCPEILLQQPYSGCLSDTWSLGVILYVLLFGQMPFNFKERFHALQHGKPHPSLEFVEDKELPYRVSDNAKDLIKKMLTSNPKERITIEEIAHHKWCAKRANILQLLGIGKCYHNADGKAKKEEKKETEKEKEKPKVDYKTKPLPDVPPKPAQQPELPPKPETKLTEKPHRRGLRRKLPEEKLGSDQGQLESLVTVKTAQEITTVV